MATCMILIFRQEVKTLHEFITYTVYSIRPSIGMQDTADLVKHPVSCRDRKFAISVSVLSDLMLGCNDEMNHQR